MSPAVIVDFEALWQAVSAAFVAGIGVVVAFSFIVLGIARFADYSRDRRPLAAALSGALAIAGILVTASAIVLGIIVMAS